MRKKRWGRMERVCESVTGLSRAVREDLSDQVNSGASSEGLGSESRRYLEEHSFTSSSPNTDDSQNKY